MVQHGPLRRCEEFLKWWSNQGCRMVAAGSILQIIHWKISSFPSSVCRWSCLAKDMTCELHDEVAAGSQFVTHFTGRVLERLALSNTPINTKAPSFNWVAVKEHNLTYYIGEALLFSIYTHYGNLI